MANFSGFPLVQTIDAFTGLVQWDDSTQLPLGSHETCQDMRFLEQSIATRHGLARAMVTGQAFPVTGAALLRFTGNLPTDVPEKFCLLYDGNGNFWRESPAGSGTLVAVASSLLKSGNYAGRMCCAYDNCYIPQSDLIEGKATPLVFSGRNKDLQQMSFRPWGLPWEKATAFRVGAIVSPVVENGRIYRCNVAGTSGAVEPVWPTGDAATVGDNGITWQECTPWIGTTIPAPIEPVIARHAAVGTYAAGRDVYVKTTLQNGLGQTSTLSQAPDMLASTVLNDAVDVPAPAVPSWNATLAAPYKVLGWNVYVADVAHGAAAPANSSYKRANVWVVDTVGNSGAVRAANVVTIKTTSAHGLAVGSPFTLAGVGDASFNVSGIVATVPDATHFTFAQVGANVTSGGGTVTGPIALTFGSLTVTGPSTGAAAPDFNDAFVAGAGNICSGKRWMAVLAELNSGYVVGIADPMPVSMTAEDSGRSLLVRKIPLGPANTKRRILAFTAAGDSRGGRYFYIPDNDKLYPGDTEAGGYVEVTKTVIEDNVTTSAIFNFPDPYLTDLPTEVTSYFNKTEIPPCADIYFSKALDRLIFTGAKGFPSGHIISDAGDPETIRIIAGGSELEVAEKDGDRTVTWREVGTVQYSLKENAGYSVSPSDANPGKWEVKEEWTKSGPCGPLAVDTNARFMVYWHTSGPYVMANTAPVFLGPALTKIIARVNRGAKQTIWTHIDEEAKEISFGLPLDGATKPNYRLRLKVREWDQLTNDEVAFTRGGVPIPNAQGRKWSLDPMNVSLMLTVDRDLTVPVDARVDHRQVLYCSNQNDGLVRYENPLLTHDVNAAGASVGIGWKLKGVLFGKGGWILGLGGATIAAKGNGLLKVTAISHVDPIDLTEKKDCPLDANVDTHFDLVARNAYDEHLGLMIEGDGSVDSWVELHSVTMYLKMAWAARRG